jgi:L-alanine-DL-glutamate epimerase-like enolase superfamily enzyme
MKITGLKIALIGEPVERGLTPVVRVMTDEGISGYAQIESNKPYVKNLAAHFEKFILGADPTNVQSVFMRIRRYGGNKPWGSVVSAIETACWDIAGKAAGLPIYKLMGGKVRDKVRVYNGGVRFKMDGHSPEQYAENVLKMKEAKEGFTIIKQPIGFHPAAYSRPTSMPQELDDFFYGERRFGWHYPNRGHLTTKGLDHIVKCIEAMTDALGDVALTLDCGPGFVVPDAIRLCRAVEDLNVLWLEDMLTGDYTPYVGPDLYREVTTQTTANTHTGEQIYLRENYKELIETKAVRVIGPDPCDIGGLSELKWVAEYADLHGIQFAPHGVLNGVLGMAAHVQVCSTLPDNFIAFEYPTARQPWWFDILDGLPDQIVKDGFIEVWDRPGLGITFRENEAKKYLTEEDKNFFD